MAHESEYVRYRLTGSEMQLAANAGVQRTLYRICNPSQQGRYGDKDPPNFHKDVCGCLGELALAKHLNRYWNGNYGDFNAADVDRDYQVRANDFGGKRGGCILHPLINGRGDKDHQPFVRGFVRLPDVELRGWVFGREGKLDRYWRTDLKPGRDCYIVPDADLHPMLELPIL